MADTFKVLGQADPIGGVLTALYTVPGATQVTTSSITVCNRNDFASSFRLAVAVAGAADDLKQYIYYDQEVKAKSTFIATIGMTLQATDVVRVQTLGGVSVNLFGVEVT